MNNFIDLDNIEDDTPTPETVGGVSGVPSAPIKGVDSVTSKAPGAGMSLDLMYVKHQKQVFLFDTSGSMGEPLQYSDRLIDYHNVDNFLEFSFKQYVAAPHQLLRYYTSTHPLYQEFLELSKDLRLLEDIEYARQVVSNKKGLVELFASCGFLYSSAFYYNQNDSEARFKTRLQIVQTSLINVIRKRCEDNPDADLVAAYFDDDVHPIEAATIDELAARIQHSPKGGGTSIMKAVNYGLNVCSRFPSKVGLNRIILVTDCDDNSFDVPALHQRFKESRAMLDVLQIAKEELGCAKELRTLCKATGGDYIVVGDAKEFEAKFLEVAERRLLTTSTL